VIRESLPDCSGTYVLVLESCTFAELAIGRLGTLHLEPGCYLYVGSAFGPGGIAARVGRHAQTEKTARWHIDYLRERTRLVEVWYQCGDVHHEAQWAEVLAGMRGLRAPLAGFGASDGAPGASHLFFARRCPTRQGFRQALRRAGLPDTDLRAVRIET